MRYLIRRTGDGCPVGGAKTLAEARTVARLVLERHWSIDIVDTRTGRIRRIVPPKHQHHHGGRTQ